MSILRPLPEIGEVRMQFEIQRVDYAAPETSGAIGGVQAGWPVWMMRLSLTAVRFEQADILRAWHRRLRGQQRKFLGRDTWRPFPVAYRRHGFRNMLRVGGGAFDGTASGWSQTIDANGDAWLRLDGLASGLILSAGDYVGFKWSSADAAEGEYDRFTLASVNERAIANAAGTIVVEIDPVVPAWVPEDAVAYLERPACLMKLVDGTQMPANERGWAEAGGVIAAVQVLER